MQWESRLSFKRHTLFISIWSGSLAVAVDHRTRALWLSPPQSVHMASLAPLGSDDTHTHGHTFTEVCDGVETVVVFEQFWLMQFLSCFRLFASGVSPAAGCAIGVKHCMTETHCMKHCMTATQASVFFFT